MQSRPHSTVPSPTNTPTTKEGPAGNTTTCTGRPHKRRSRPRSCYQERLPLTIPPPWIEARVPSRPIDTSWLDEVRTCHECSGRSIPCRPSTPGPRTSPCVERPTPKFAEFAIPSASWTRPKSTTSRDSNRNCGRAIKRQKRLSNFATKGARPTWPIATRPIRATPTRSPAFRTRLLVVPTTPIRRGFARVDEGRLDGIPRRRHTTKEWPPSLGAYPLQYLSHCYHCHFRSVLPGGFEGGMRVRCHRRAIADPTRPNTSAWLLGCWGFHSCSAMLDTWRVPDHSPSRKR